jgi:hypothetical protein
MSALKLGIKTVLAQDLEGHFFWRSFIINNGTRDHI